MRNYFILILMTCMVLAVGACEKKEAIKPEDKGVNITTAQVVRKDMPVVESAVGTQTSLSMAKALDPTRVAARAPTVRLPFPAHVARNLKIGQKITLSSFENPDQSTQGHIVEIRPGLNTSTDSMEVIAEVGNDRRWNPSGSLRGEIVMAVNKGALVVPEQAVVIRPAGAVVYSVEKAAVKAHTVVTGVSRDGLVEIRSGLKAGDTVAVDGASLLTDGAKVSINNPAPGRNPP